MVKNIFKVVMVVAIIFMVSPLLSQYRGAY